LPGQAPSSQQIQAIAIKELWNFIAFSKARVQSNTSFTQVIFNQALHNDCLISIKFLHTKNLNQFADEPQQST
jgi:hypothetical protein